MGYAILFVSVIAFVLVIKATLMLTAGLGVLYRKSWGRILTLSLAAWAGMSCLFALLERLFADTTNGISPVLLAIAIGQILYATLTFIILIKNGAEFRQLKVGDGTLEHPARSAAVTTIGFVTVFLAIGYAVFGIWMFFGMWHQLSPNNR